jgi:hypothetical protein
MNMTSRQESGSGSVAAFRGRQSLTRGGVSTASRASVHRSKTAVLTDDYKHRERTRT